MTLCSLWDIKTKEPAKYCADYVRTVQVVVPCDLTHVLFCGYVFQFYRGNLGDFFVGAFYMIEVTIPFISARAVLAQVRVS